MSDGSAGTGRQPYNRPRRYPVEAADTPAAEPSGLPEAPAEVTRRNPSLAEAAQEYEQRRGGPVPAAAQPYAYPPPAVGPVAPGPSLTQSRRGLLIGLGVLVLIAVVGLALGLSGGDSTPSRASSAPQAQPVPATPTSTPSTAAAPPASVGETCIRLGGTAPFTSFVVDAHPTQRMPTSYVEPQAGTKVAVCVASFRPAAGAGRGRFAYLAAYQRLQAVQYAVRLKTLGWTLAPGLPNPTYRNPLNTTVTLVQQGSTLITMVGTGR